LDRDPIREVDDGDDQDIVIRMGRDELLIRRRYQTLSILNDFLIGVWFLVGSVAFFWPDWVGFGTGLFVLGSAQLLIRPVIRLAHSIHLRPMPPGHWEM
jgi:hypothetical protein